MSMLEVLDPTMDAPNVRKQLAPRIADPNGKNVGFRIIWSRFDAFIERFEELLRQRYRVGEVHRFHGYLNDITTKDTKSRFTAEKLKEREAFWGKSDYAVIGAAA